MVHTALESQAFPSDLPLKQWTVDEFHQMLALGILSSDTPVELINGQIIEMVPQEPPHAATTDEGGDYLKALFLGKAKVRAQLPITLYPDSEPEPDFAIVRIDANRYRDRHPGPEDIYLVMEVADSTLRRDRQYKAQMYAKAGIPEYWIINLQQNQVIVYRHPQNSAYESAQVFDSSAKVSPEAFPDIEVDLGQLLILN
ncbi:MAG: Uma2 family endonuclease [Cyanothece sp. SIO1E1]|nr:Uma2 family endonuclease [Cyanothece sp. SIO1E1]